MIIPPETLTVEVIRSIIESVIVREGTDYGEQELLLSEKVENILPQVLKGEVLICYDEENESVNLLPKEDVAQSA